MKMWMDVMRDLESVMDDHERILDAWAEGGVDGVVFGPLVFGTNRLSQGAKVLESGQSWQRLTIPILLSTSGLG